MDDLSVALNNSGIGGYLGGAFLNHLCYADDICLISLSSDNVVRYYIVYSMYGFVTFYAYLFSSICVVMKIKPSGNCINSLEETSHENILIPKKI